MDQSGRGSQTMSAISKTLQDSQDPQDSGHPVHLSHLALQTLHNLQHAHSWTSLTIHTDSPKNPEAPLPRPLISGVPPQRIYTHPDEQIELLKSGEDGSQRKEREWVLPTHLNETWSLRKFADVFDAIGPVPPGKGGDDHGRPRHKRLLLGTLGNDSTIVYYIVHDGLVKPRQN